MNLRWKPNVTAAAIIEQDGKFLLVEEQTSDGLRLNNPAGHLDLGETPEQACRRETLEETTHTFEPTALVGVYQSRQKKAGEDITYLRFAYCGVLGPADPSRQLDSGIVRTVWMTAEEIRANVDRLRSAIVLRCLEDYLAGRRFPLTLVVTHGDLSAAAL